MNNEDEMFCLISKIIAQIGEDFTIVNKDQIKLNKKGDELLILDKIKGRIAMFLADEWGVKTK